MSNRLLAWAFGLAPALMILLTWDNHAQSWHAKIYTPTVIAVEVVTIILAFLRGMRPPRTRATALLGVLVLLAWGSALAAPHLPKALIMTELWTVHILFGFAAARLFTARALIMGLVTGFLLSATLLALFAALAPPHFTWVGEMPGLGNPRSFALYAAVAIGLALGLLAAGHNSAAPVALIGFALLFWSGSRGGIAASILCLGAGLLLFPALRRGRVWGTFVGSAAVGAVMAKLTGSPATLIGVSRMSETSDNGRFSLWRVVVDRIADRPWFGHGEGQTEHLSGIVWAFHPHNIALQTLLAWGAVGSILIVWLAFEAARRLRGRVADDELPLACAMIMLIAYSLFDGALYNVLTSAIFAACLGVSLRAAKRFKQQK